MKKINKTLLINLTKWFLLGATLTMTAFLVLAFYNGKWGFAPFTDSSQFDVDSSKYSALANYISGNKVIGEGGGILRTKQLIISFIGGGTLAFAGALLQKVTRNNLAEVSILGIGSINILFIFAYVFIFKDKVFANGVVGYLLPLVTLAASIIGTIIVWIVSRSKRANKNTFVIVGIAIQLLFEALSVVFVNPSKLEGKEGKEIWNTIKNYTMGQVRTSELQNGVNWWLIILAAVIIGAVITIALFLRKKIDIYETSEESAKTLGINVKFLRLGIFIMVAILAGIEASILGTVALLGIIGPSISRLMFKNKFAPMAIGSFIIGGILVTLASFISTNLGTNLPPGILTTAIASPYFIFLILRGK